MAQYYPRHVHDTKKQFSHTPTSMNKLHSKQSHEIYLQIRPSFLKKNVHIAIQISYAITRHLNS